MLATHEGACQSEALCAGTGVLAVLAGTLAKSVRYWPCLGTSPFHTQVTAHLLVHVPRHACRLRLHLPPCTGLSGEPTHEQVTNMLALVTSLYSVAANLTASNGPRLQLSSGIHTTAAQVRRCSGSQAPQTSPAVIDHIISDAQEFVANQLPWRALLLNLTCNPPACLQGVLVGVNHPVCVSPSPHCSATGTCVSLHPLLTFHTCCSYLKHIHTCLFVDTPAPLVPHTYSPSLARYLTRQPSCRWETGAVAHHSLHMLLAEHAQTCLIVQGAASLFTPVMPGDLSTASGAS
jgi:hypothetical protein